MRAYGCHSQQQMGSLAKRNEQHLWKKQSWEIARLAYDKKHPWGVHRRLWGCILSRKTEVSPKTLIKVQDSFNSELLDKSPSKQTMGQRLAVLDIDFAGT